MKKIIGISFLLFAVSITFVSAATTLPSSLVPCGTDASGNRMCTPCDLWLLGSNIINFALYGLALPILVILLLIAGIMMVFGGSNQGTITAAHKLLWSSVVGILISFGAWLIVNTIINTLAEGKPVAAWNTISCPANVFNAPPPAISTQPPFSANPIPKQNLPANRVFQTEDAARAYLLNNGFNTSDLKPACQAGQTTNCENLAGLPINAAQDLVDLKQATSGSCSFRISSGTEAGHVSHAPGKPIVDIVPYTLNQQQLQCLQTQANILSPNSAFCEAQGGARISNCASPANHIHVTLPI